MAHSCDKDTIPKELQIGLEHLSKQRVYESFLYGLELVQCEHLRPKIWKMICCHTTTEAIDYEQYLTVEDARMDNKIAKDIHRTIPGSQEFC